MQGQSFLLLVENCQCFQEVCVIFLLVALLLQEI